MKKGYLQIRERELKKLEIIHRVVERTMKQKEAAKILSLSCRQACRISRRIKQEALHL